jgi:hypothetical protein
MAPGPAPDQLGARTACDKDAAMLRQKFERLFGKLGTLPDLRGLLELAHFGSELFCGPLGGGAPS